MFFFLLLFLVVLVLVLSIHKQMQISTYIYNIIYYKKHISSSSQSKNKKQIATSTARTLSFVCLYFFILFCLSFLFADAFGSHLFYFCCKLSCLLIHIHILNRKKASLFPFLTRGALIGHLYTIRMRYFWLYIFFKALYLSLVLSL